MSDVAFVDTNMLVYAHDQDAGQKRQRALDTLKALWATGTGRLSVQVLQEFYVSVTRKLTTPVARSTAREVLAAYGPWIRTPTTATTVTRAVDIADMAEISFWDALIVASAEDAGATLLYSEDMNPGQVIAGVKVVNPLLTV